MRRSDGSHLIRLDKDGIRYVIVRSIPGGDLRLTCMMGRGRTPTEEWRATISPGVQEDFLTGVQTAVRGYRRRPGWWRRKPTQDKGEEA